MSETIHIIPKNKRERYHFTREAFQGRDYFSIRIWYLDNDSGDFKPTRKGVSFPVERMGEFLDGVDALKTDIGIAPLPQSIPQAERGADHG